MGCSGQPVTTETDPPGQTAIRHLFLGDSYTIGEGVAGNQSWPQQLADSLRKQGKTISSLKIIAKTGWTAARLLQGIRDIKPDSNWTHVSLLIGVNNQYQRGPLTEFLTGLDTLLTVARNLTPSGTVYMLSIPDYSYTPFAGRDSLQIRTEIEQYNRELKKVARERELVLIDATTVSKLAGKDRSLLASDRLHPSAKQYQVWVDSVLHRIRF